MIGRLYEFPNVNDDESLRRPRTQIAAPLGKIQNGTIHLHFISQEILRRYHLMTYSISQKQLYHLLKI
jgi:hypothetical protein